MLSHNLNRLLIQVSNHLAEQNDDVRYNQVVEFFRTLAEGQWEEEMADALEALGYTVTKE